MREPMGGEIGGRLTLILSVGGGGGGVKGNVCVVRGGAGGAT